MSLLKDNKFVRAKLAKARSYLAIASRTFHILARGIEMIVAASPRAAAGTVALVAVASLLPIGQVWLAKLVVDHLAGDAGGQPDIETAIKLAIVYVLVLIALEAVEPIHRSLATWFEARAVAAVDHRLMEGGRRLRGLQKIERPTFQDELPVLQDNAYYLPFLFTSLPHGPGRLITLAGMLILLGNLHVLIPIALVLAGSLHLLSQERLTSSMWSTALNRSRESREMDYCTRVATAPDLAKEVRVFNLGEFFIRRFRKHSVIAIGQLNSLHFLQLRTTVVFTGLYALVLAFGFFYVASQSSAGRLTLGDVALYLNIVIQAESRLLTLVGWFGDTYDSFLHLRALVGFDEDTEPELAMAPNDRSLQAPAQLNVGVEFRSASFRYPESVQDVLVDVTARLPAGQITAIVGANGAGKSTLVKLLTRMYDPTGGEIMIDGVPIRSYDVGSLRRRISVVYQDFARFALTLDENISVGATATRSERSVEMAARWAGADEIAAKLEHGYDTQLTRMFEGGVELSGGEWQKVALARSFMRDAAFVILDEPTAALDAEAEHELFRHFRQLVAGKTALIISHRFSTVHVADHILVLDDGRITESGSHAELLSRNGRYAKMYRMQAMHYQTDPAASAYDRFGDDS